MVSCYGNLSRLRQYADSKFFKGDYREDSERQLFFVLIGIKIILGIGYTVIFLPKKLRDQKQSGIFNLNYFL